MQLPWLAAPSARTALKSGPLPPELEPDVVLVLPELEPEVEPEVDEVDEVDEVEEVDPVDPSEPVEALELLPGSIWRLLPLTDVERSKGTQDANASDVKAIVAKRPISSPHDPDYADWGRNGLTLLA